MTNTVTSTMTESEINEIIDAATNAYQGDVQVDVSYDIVGAIAISTDGSETDDEQLIEALQKSIAEALNVHPSDVEINIDPESGAATYTISSETAEDADSLQETLLSGALNQIVLEDIAEDISSVTDVTCIQIFKYFRNPLALFLSMYT